MNKLEKVVYTAKATSTGGREGTSKSDDGRLNINLSTPKALGGNDGPRTILSNYLRQATLLVSLEL